MGLNLLSPGLLLSIYCQWIRLILDTVGGTHCSGHVQHIFKKENANPETPPAILQIEAVFDFQSLGLLSDNDLVPNIKSRVFFFLLSRASTCLIGLGLKKRVERRPTFGYEFIVSLTHLKNKEKSREQTNKLLHKTMPIRKDNTEKCELTRLFGEKDPTSGYRARSFSLCFVVCCCFSLPRGKLAVLLSFCTIV